MLRKLAAFGAAILVVAAMGVVAWWVLSGTVLSGKDSSNSSTEVVEGDGGSVELFAEFYDQAEEMMEGMSLAEKVGQMFLVRFEEERVARELAGGEPAGYILFGKDFAQETPESLRAKLQRYHDLSAHGLIFGVDEEGGTVVRASRYSAFRAEPFLSPRELWTEGGRPRVLADVAEKTALLKSLGINMNLAPVADVSVNPSDFMYQRTLGEGATTTAEYVAAVVGQMQQDGVISVMKHFPGYGNNGDTHTDIVIDKREYEVFQEEDFLPFRAGILAGGSSILVSHNIVEAIDKERPASLSKKVHEILRDELGFSGVIMTDDLAMGAVQDYAEGGSGAVLAVLAGNDLIITSNFEEHQREVLEAVEWGEIEESAIDLAVRRVLAMKIAYGVAKE